MNGHTEWYESPDGSNIGGFGLSMTPRDQARFGLLYLHGGKWEDRQVIPAEWVATSTRVHSNGNRLYGQYGYHWWVGEMGSTELFFAMGYAGQYIYVVPEHQLVVVLNSNSPGNDRIPQRIMASVLDTLLF